MPGAILTLQVPKGARGIPVATTSDARALQAFRHAILEEWAVKLETATDEVEAALYRLEIDRLERALALLIPEHGGEG